MNHHLRHYFPNNAESHWYSRFTVLAIIAVLVAIAFLYQPVFSWFIYKMSLANGYLHIAALSAVLGIALYRWRLATNALHFPVLLHLGSIIWISASVLYLFNEANIGFHTLSAALFIAFLYGFVGHFVSAALWRAMLLPSLLMILVLPFEHYLDVYLGFPLRLLSANWASSILQFAQLPSLTVESILMIDNKAAVVDVDCSGINSLWIGIIFYLLLTWVERFAISRNWFVIGITFLFLLVLANVLRIVVLVVLELVIEAPELAAVFHQTLGLLGFAIACLITWWLLNQFAPKQTATALPAKIKHKANLLTPIVMLAIISVFIATYQPHQTPPIENKHHTFEMPQQYYTQATKLSEQETSFFVSNQAKAEKYIVDVDSKRGIKASVVMVWSRAWKAHHIPENCYLSQGYSISSKGVWNINPQHNVRYLALDKTNTKTQSLDEFTSLYWFQSQDSNTPDYSSRVIDNFLNPNREWVMVSILWNQSVAPLHVTPFLDDFKQSLEDHFNENQ